MNGPLVERFGCFGKLPVSREFLIEGSRDLADSRFDRWIGEGLGLAKARLGPRFDAVFTEFPEYDFIWSAGAGKRVFAGRLVPSEDGAGRKHPFALFAILDPRRVGQPQQLLAYSLRGLFASLTRLLEAARLSPSAPELLTLVRSASYGDPLERDAGAADFTRYVASTPADAFWAGVGADGDASLRFTVMQGFVETLAPMKGKDSRDLRFGLRFPLTRGDDPAALLAAAFWLDLVARRLGKPLERTTAFWSSRGGGGFAPVLFLLPAEPAPTHVASLVDRDAESETVSYLDKPYGSQPAASRMDPALRGVLEAPGRTLDDYRHWAVGPR